MSETLIDRAREGRKSPATLKIKASNLRSRYPSEPILIVEGPEDVGPYETWIRAEHIEQFLLFLPGCGKEQLLGLRRLLSKDETGLFSDIYFFVDRDFDGLQGQQGGSDIYCFDRYSVENYLSTELVVRSVLRDEFRLDPASQDFETALGLYINSLRELATILTPINHHIFVCRRLGVRFRNKIPDIKKIVNINLIGVTLQKSIEEILINHLETTTEIRKPDTPDMDTEFDALDPIKEHRGKFFFDFLRAWLDLLAEDARAFPNGKYILSKVNVKYSPASFDLRSCASRSERPRGLREFVGRIYRPAQQSIAACA